MLKMIPLKLKGERERLGKPRSQPWVPFVDCVCSVVNGICSLFNTVFTACSSLLFGFGKENGGGHKAVFGDSP